MSDQSLDSNPLKDRRRWWVALLMLFPTGAGYIYVGRPMRFVAFTAFVLLILAALFQGTWVGIEYPVVFQVFLAILALVSIGFSIDLVTIAVKQNSHNLRWPQRRKWYVASLILWSVIIFASGPLDQILGNL